MGGPLQGLPPQCRLKGAEPAKARSWSPRTDLKNQEYVQKAQQLGSTQPKISEQEASRGKEGCHLDWSSSYSAELQLSILRGCALWEALRSGQEGTVDIIHRDREDRNGDRAREPKQKQGRIAPY